MRRARADHGKKSPRGGMLSALVVVAVGLALTASQPSCMLLISAETYPGPCRFDGADTQCGACVRAQCQEAMNGCCGDDACLPLVKSVETCALTHDASCDDLRGARHPPNGKIPSPLAVCAVDQCGAVCDRLAGASQTRCKEPALGEGSTCTCEAAPAFTGSSTGKTAKGEPANDFVCGATTFPETICCAPRNWPSVGQECTCSALSCTPSPGGCFCSSRSFTPEQRQCSGLHCCVESDNCECNARECFEFETPVARCEVAAVGCKKDQVRVDSCSARR